MKGIIYQCGLLLAVLTIILGLGVFLDTVLLNAAPDDDETTHQDFVYREQTQQIRVQDHYHPKESDLLSHVDGASVFSVGNASADVSHSLIQLRPHLSGQQHYKRICYYNGPSANDSADELQPEAINPFLCTHIILFTGVSIVNDTIQLASDHAQKVVERTVGLKFHNPSLRVMICLGNGFSQLVTNRTAVIRFSYNTRMFMEQHQLDGLDIDWEFPAWPAWHSKREKEGFVFLTGQLSTALRLVSPSYLLSIAVTGVSAIIDHSYDFPKLASNVDWVSLMGYDYSMYQSYLPFTGHNSPLFSHPSYRGYFATLNSAWSVQAFMDRGLGRDKLLLGLPTYAKTWRLVSPSWQGLQAPAAGPGLGGGAVSQSSVDAFLRSGAEKTMDCWAKVSYAARGMDWMSYETVESAHEKALYVRSLGLAGMMTFDLNYDDWSKGDFPIHHAIKEVLTADDHLAQLLSERYAMSCQPRHYQTS